MSIVSNHEPQTIDEINGRPWPTSESDPWDGDNEPSPADLADMARHHALANVSLDGLDGLAGSLDRLAADCRSKCKEGEHSWTDGMETGMAAAFELASRWLRTEVAKIKE